jgi:transposase
MLGEKDRRQPELFVAGSLRELLPDDHILVRVDRVLDLSWLRGEVVDLYSADKGRPGIDPEAAVRLMLAGFLLGIVHDRRLMREAQVNLAIRWFTGYALYEVLPDHSSLTRIRQRWGVERFRQIFERTVQACIAAKIAKGEFLHVDASLIRADVRWESLAVRHVQAVEQVNRDEVPDELAKKESRQTGRYKKVCITDPDATMATNGRNRRLEPAYKQHAAVDDLRGVIVDVEVTTGETNEGQVVIGRIDAAAALDRTQPGLPIKKGRAGTMTHDYIRNGTTTLFAALNVLDGTIIGQCMARHRHQEFIRFLNRIEAAVPAGKLVHAILDNYAAHKHPKVRAWLARHPR